MHEAKPHERLYVINYKHPEDNIIIYLSKSGVKNEDEKVTVVPDNENQKSARLRDGKCLIFTTDFEKLA